jgi:metaxin
MSPILDLIYRLQGMPSQETYDRGIALAQLILGHLLPAYLASLPEMPISTFAHLSNSISSSGAKLNHLLFPTPPPLAAGLKTPLPAALTGDARTIDREEVLARGIDALNAVRLAVRDDWALGAK